MSKKQYNKFVSFFLCVVFAVIGYAVGFVGLYAYIVKTEIAKIVVYNEGAISFHFLELGNEYTGDCTYIKAGEVDILIDAGSKVDSISTITSYINQFVKDNTLEYVIVTHAHEDHYAGFATNVETDSIFDLYNIGTIIDFSQITNGKESGKMYKNYVRELSEAVEKGAKHYTAYECVNNQNGASSMFEISNDVTMKILNQRYYSERSTSENNHSVCTLFTHGENNFLFTGDLEKKGEESLVELNSLPKCVLYKAGHHGSVTSSNEVLLEVIQPEICCVCCCAGSVEYTQENDNRFPTQDFINRISLYTDKVYVTTLCYVKQENGKWVNNGFTSMNGNIVVTSSTAEVTVDCSNNNTILKDTSWFKDNRTCPQKWLNAS